VNLRPEFSTFVRSAKAASPAHVELAFKPATTAFEPAFPLDQW
jgi:hypothetical protein